MPVLVQQDKGEARKALREALKDRDDEIIPAVTNITLNYLLESWLEDMESCKAHT